MILQRTYNLVVCVRDREGAGERRSRRHSRLGGPKRGGRRCVGEQCDDCVCEMTQLSRFQANTEETKRLARGLRVRELQFCCAWWVKQLLGWNTLSQRREVRGLSMDQGWKLKLKRALTRPLSKEQAPNKLAKGRTVLDNCRNKQQELHYGRMKSFRGYCHESPSKKRFTSNKTRGPM